MDNKKFFSKYKKLFKTQKAVDYFLEEYKDKLPLWQEIMKYYCPKTGKVNAKVNRTDLADRVFSEYDRLYYSDDMGFCVCVTSGVKLPWNEMQAGHYRTRAHYPTRFDIRNVHPQTYKDNCLLSGNYRNYHIFMIKKYGPELEDRLWTNNDTADYNQERYEHNILERYQFITEKKEMIKKYKKDLKGE